MHIQLSDDRLVNLGRVVEVRISAIDDTKLKYILNTTEEIVEKFDSFDAAEAAMLLLQEDPFILTEDDRLINLDYVKDVKINAVNPAKIEFEMFDAAPVKVAYESAEAAESALEQIITDLTTE